MLRTRTMTAVFVALTLLGRSGFAAETAPSVVDETDLQAAVAGRVSADDAARERIQSLLQREDVREMARGYGLDARRAEAAVATLDGADLQSVADQASVAEMALAGGEVVQISLVALLLIIIIVILIR
jgi:hypothetical protein